MTGHRYDRRAFLAGLGLSPLLLPRLNARPVHAAEAQPGKRLIVVAVPNGYRESVYYPGGGRFDFSIPTDAEVDPSEKHSPLAPLAPHRNDIIFVGNLTFENAWDTHGGAIGGHASLPFLLTGARGVPGPRISDGLAFSASVPSVDQFIAQKLAERHRTPFSSLVLAPLKEGGNDRYLSFFGKPLDPTTPNAPTPRVDPVQLFIDLFGSQGLDQATLARLRRNRRSILDLVGKELESFRLRLGTDDRQKVEAHLDTVRAIERQMAFAESGCKPPPVPVDVTKDYLNNNGNPLLNEVLKLQIDLTVAAMACDGTRVASMLWSNSSNVRWVYHWLGKSFTQPGADFANKGENQGLRNHHEIAHRDGQAEFKPLMNRVNQWYLEQFAYLIERLKATPDVGGKTLFYGSALLYANMQRTGGGHQTDRVAWILAGSAHGHFKTGQYIQHPSGKPGRSAPQNAILTALCNAMDVPAQHYGSPDYGGPCAELRG